MPCIARRTLLTGAVCAAAFPSAPAHADGASEQFVRALARDAFALSHANAEAEAYAALIARAADIGRIARLTLGRHGRAFTSAQRARFETALTQHLARVLRGAMRGMDPDAFRITGSVEVRPGDALVASRMQRRGAEPMSMRWRVLSTSGDARLVDIEYAGVFLALQQAQDFAAVLDRANGDPEALIARLERSNAA